MGNHIFWAKRGCENSEEIRSKIGRLEPGTENGKKNMERAAKVRSDIFGVSHPVNMSALSLKSEFTLFHDFVNTPSCL